LTVHSTNPSREKKFFFSPKCPDWLCGLLGVLFSGYWGSKRLGHEGNCSIPSSAKVKNEWNYTSASCICLHGVDREDYLYTGR
jgi:hypothetical protein